MICTKTKSLVGRCKSSFLFAQVATNCCSNGMQVVASRDCGDIKGAGGSRNDG